MERDIIYGVDTSKSVFQVCVVTERGKKISDVRLSRGKFLAFFSNKKRGVVALEATGSSHHWGRELLALGHEVRLIPPQYVKPYVRRNKNDRNDAEAIAKAARDESIRPVPVKSVAEQENMLLLRRRAQLVEQRTSTANQLRSVLSEFGYACNKGISGLRILAAQILGEENAPLTARGRYVLQSSLDTLEQLDKELQTIEQLVRKGVVEHPEAQRLLSIPGVGTLIAFTMISMLGDPHRFDHGRHFAAYLGLVPRQFSSGKRVVLGGISKRGNTYLRTLLVQGAHSILIAIAKRGPKNAFEQWAQSLLERRGRKVAVVAIANKLARILWKVLATPETTFDPNRANGKQVVPIVAKGDDSPRKKRTYILQQLAA